VRHGRHPLRSAASCAGLPGDRPRRRKNLRHPVAPLAPRKAIGAWGPVPAPECPQSGDAAVHRCAERLRLPRAPPGPLRVPPPPLPPRRPPAGTATRGTPPRRRVRSRR
jgi:hypothetical protein